LKNDPIFEAQCAYNVQNRVTRLLENVY